MPWIVNAKPPDLESGKAAPLGWDYRDGYFPRKYHYKKEAMEAAQDALDRGGREVTVTKAGK